MNKKKHFFLLFNSLLIFGIIALNNYILFIFALKSIYIIILVTLLSIVLYFFISYSLIDDIFTLDEKLKIKIETTMHEINTPVSTIQINTDILLSKIDDEKNQNRLHRINKACNNLFKLYEDMEYYIKKEIDRVEIIDFSLQELVEHIVLQFQDIKNDIIINIKIKNLIIQTDKNGFEIMISNLISNAIKHNKYITKIELLLQGDTLIIKDDGEGINSENIYSMFNRYYQAENKVHGFGIGLSIVKEFCDKQKIDIKIDTSSKGTVFKLNLNNIIKRG
jgi:two-component system, OmpR family, sensor kinase